MMKLPELKEFLETLAKTVRWSDDEGFMPNDYAGGNIDDAYSGGVEDGRVDLARELLLKLKE